MQDEILQDWKNEILSERLKIYSSNETQNGISLIGKLCYLNILDVI